MNDIGLIQVVLFFVVLFIVFLIMRKVNLWYFKINYKIELQEETNRLLKQLVDERQKPQSPISLTNNLSEDNTNVNDPEVLNTILERLNTYKIDK
jgi:cell division protein FtsL